MKIVIAYPPLESKKGIPLLGQNRQFQWTKTPWRAYPMVPAYAATLLKSSGYEVVWLDGIASGWSYQEWEERLKKEDPDLVMIETKTPVVKRHWKIIDKLKIVNCKLKIILVGDHVTALPGESFQNSQVDYILTGGDYDFLLLNLVNHLTKGEKLEPGIWWRKQSKVKSQKLKVKKTSQRICNTGKFVLNHDLDKLPFIDRELTHRELYAYKNSNYSRTPGTYTMFGRDCWWGRCSFCSWSNLFPGSYYRVMSPERALDEIGDILEKYPVREIMDDSGTFPVGEWLRKFCWGMIERGYNRKIKINCNMRFNASLSSKDYELMARAGFRFILYGLESANQKTLDRLNKNLEVKKVPKVLRMAKRAGLWPHVTIMVGYPWEGRKETEKTIKFAKKIFRDGLADTLQATVMIPYPGTLLFDECKEKGWLKTLDWDRYDMKEPIMKAKLSDSELMADVRRLYSSIWSPQFIWRKVKEAISSPERFRYYVWLGLKFISRKIDFGKN